MTDTFDEARLKQMQDAIDRALSENVYTLSALLSHPAARPRSNIVVWICDPNDDVSRDLARKIHGSDFDEYERDVRNIAARHNLRPLFFLALRREFAVLHVRAIPQPTVPRSNR